MVTAIHPATHLNPEWLPAEQRVELDQQQLDHDHARIDHDTHSLLADQSKLLDDIGARDEARHQVDVDHAQELRFEESELRDDLHTLEQLRDADQAHLDAVQATVDHDQAVVDADHHRLDGDHARLDRDQADYDRDWLEAHPTERAIAEARHLPAAVNVEP